MKDQKYAAIVTIEVNESEDRPSFRTTIHQPTLCVMSDGGNGFIVEASTTEPDGFNAEVEETVYESDPDGEVDSITPRHVYELLVKLGFNVEFVG